MSLKNVSLMDWRYFKKPKSVSARHFLILPRRLVAQRHNSMDNKTIFQILQDSTCPSASGPLDSSTTVQSLSTSATSGESLPKYIQSVNAKRVRLSESNESKSEVPKTSAGFTEIAVCLHVPEDRSIGVVLAAVRDALMANGALLVEWEVLASDGESSGDDEEATQEVEWEVDESADP